MFKAKVIITIIYPVIITAIFTAATAQLSLDVAPAPPVAGAPSPGGVDCFPYLINLSDCLTFVEGGSNLTEPEPGCCPELAKLVNTQPVCLCQLIGNRGQSGISVDVKRALKLPSLCNVTTPPVSLCAAIGALVGDLTPSEAPSPGAEAATTSPEGSSGSPINLPSEDNFLIGFAIIFFTYLFS